MSDKALISLNNTSLTAVVTQSAVEIKEEALNSAALIGRVTDANENNLANDALSKLSDLRRQIEKARKEAKEPVLKFGRQIDSTAEAFISDVTKEEARVSKLIGDFFQLENAKRQASERLVRLEAERIERERLVELQRIAEQQARESAVLKAQEAEAARLAGEAKTNAQKVEAERLRLELERARELAASKSHDDLNAAQEKFCNKQAELAAAPVAAPIRASGQTVKPTLEITVTDIWLLAKAHPTCVSITPMMSEIKSLLSLGVAVKGVTVKEVFKATARTSQVAAIEV